MSRIMQIPPSSCQYVPRPRLLKHYTSTAADIVPPIRVLILSSAFQETSKI